MNGIVNAKEDIGFYPTPPELAQKMLSGIDLSYVQTVLEPSAGKGNILKELAKKAFRYITNLDVDCIEIDPHLRQILNYTFSSGRELEINQKIRDLESKQTYSYETHDYKGLTAKEEQELHALRVEESSFFKNGIHIVHDDFLTFNTFKKYDLIIMNPPFASGDKHLLKAIKLQERGGSIVCILNAETLKNPYTQSRKDLLTMLNKYNATIEYIADAFKNAERKTDVEIALIKIYIEPVQEKSDIYERLKKAAQLDDFQPDATELEVSDYIKAAVARFNVEVQAGIELIRQYKAMKPYLLNSFDDDDKYKHSLLRLTDTYERSYDDVSVNNYLKAARLKYWRELLKSPKFTGKLTSKLQDEYRERVEKYADYDFSEYNIYTLVAEMNSKIKTGVENEIIAMFDRLTEEHSWYPETQKNRHYYDGWATNKAHKIGKKVIIPCYGVFSEWDSTPRTYKARAVLEDIEKILNFLDGGMTADVDFWHSLENCFNQGITKNIQLKYFKATFYKKGTVHLVFTCPELIERFNIYAAQNKKWLPPTYGKKAYADMNKEERAVIDSFQGETAYNEVMQKSSYYLAPVTGNTLLLLEE